MVYPDSESQPEHNLFHNMNSITVDVMLKVQKDIDPCDLISLVFLLYDTPETALQNLTVYQTGSKDVETSNMYLLYEWALYAKNQPTWKYKFLEALTTCRLYNVIRKLGFNVHSIKNHYEVEKVNIYIDPMKKVLYRLSESMTIDCLIKLKRTLTSFEKDVLKYETAELIFLGLICQKFITLGQYDIKKKVYTNTYDVEILAEILESSSDLSKYAAILRRVQNQINKQNGRNESQANDKLDTELKTNLNSIKAQPRIGYEFFSETYEMLNELYLENEPLENLKTDTINEKDRYIVKNKNRIGVCCIINQENFTSSKVTVNLSDRLGSNVDLTALESTMRAVKFVVRSKTNIDHVEVFDFIKDVVQNDVQSEDSLFVLCILSHGVKGHVYAADSVKIKIEDIQNYLDSNDCWKLHNVPKVLILQACQVEEQPDTDKKIVAEKPNSNFYLKKSHFLVYRDVSPEIEAYGCLGGSFFIQYLCFMIEKKVEEENLLDIFTKVTDDVIKLYTKLQLGEAPKFKSTLKKKLFLHQNQ